mmetsp:Transcript_131893/g.328885  ORF Transcript_131893/g.328885 Transcript_131893/m.328885 type:complete len:155 (-) Transcript_131893:104-568(-)
MARASLLRLACLAAAWALAGVAEAAPSGINWRAAENSTVTDGREANIKKFAGGMQGVADVQKAAKNAMKEATQKMADQKQQAFDMMKQHTFKQEAALKAAQEQQERAAAAIKEQHERTAAAMKEQHERTQAAIQAKIKSFGVPPALGLGGQKEL